jgi:hypothetical protein
VLPDFLENKLVFVEEKRRQRNFKLSLKYRYKNLPFKKKLHFTLSRRFLRKKKLTPYALTWLPFEKKINALHSAMALLEKKKLTLYAKVPITYQSNFVHLWKEGPKILTENLQKKTENGQKFEE